MFNSSGQFNNILNIRFPQLLLPTSTLTKPVEHLSKGGIVKTHTATTLLLPSQATSTSDSTPTNENPSPPHTSGSPSLITVKTSGSPSPTTPSGNPSPTSISEGLLQMNPSESPPPTTLPTDLHLTGTPTDPPMSGTSISMSLSNTPTISTVTTPSLDSTVDMHKSNKLNIIIPVASIIPALLIGCVIAWLLVKKRQGGLSGKKVTLVPFRAEDIEGRVTKNNALGSMTLRDLPLAKKEPFSGSAVQLENLCNDSSEPETGVYPTQREQHLESRLLSVMMQKFEAIEAAMQLPLERPPGVELQSSERRDGAGDWNDRPPDYVSQTEAMTSASPEGKNRH